MNFAPLTVNGTPPTTIAGFDNRAAKMEGKLIVDLGFESGNYQAWFGKRGFHVLGVAAPLCQGRWDWTLERDHMGNCRLNQLDGQPHGIQSMVDPDHSVMTQVLQTLVAFESAYPNEGWGYFLTRDGRGVRWSDVAFSGGKEQASSVILFAHALSVYRAVSYTGYSDNTCGKGSAAVADPVSPAFWPVADTCDATHCCPAHIPSWYAWPSATPIDRYFAWAPALDGHYGDEMFAMEALGYLGAPVDVGKASPPYGGSHRFYASVYAISPFEMFTDAMNVAFGVSPENLHPSFEVLNVLKSTLMTARAFLSVLLVAGACLTACASTHGVGQADAGGDGSDTSDTTGSGGAGLAGTGPNVAGSDGAAGFGMVDAADAARDDAGPGDDGDDARGDAALEAASCATGTGGIVVPEIPRRRARSP